MTDHTHLELLTDVGDVAIVVHHFDEGQVVSLPAVVVVVVVSGRDLDGSCAKRHLHHLISNYGELAVTEGMETVFSNQMLQMSEGERERERGRERERETERERRGRERTLIC